MATVSTSTAQRPVAVADGRIRLTILALRRHSAALILGCSTLCAFVYYVWDITSWKFSFVGDEWAFYLEARDIANRNLLVNPFDLHGVYGFNGVLGSLYQALFIKALGANNVAWRLSNIVLILPISLFFYLWMRESFDRPTALLSTLTLQASAYIANYLKIGYVNAQAFALFLVALYLASRCGRQLTLRNAAWLGVILGISFYIYIGPLFPVLLLPYLFPVVAQMRRRWREQWRAAALGAGLYLAIILPAAISIVDGGFSVSKTSATREFHDNFQIVVNVAHDFLLFYQNYDYFYNHFIAGPYLDVASRSLATGGMALTLIHIRRRGYLLLALTYVLVAVGIGVTSPYAYAATTRGIFFIPFGAAFAGIALATLTRWLIRGLRALFTRLRAVAGSEIWTRSMPPLLAYEVVVFALLTIWVLNVYQSQIGVFQQEGYSATALIIGVMQDAQQSHQTRVALVVSDREPYSDYQVYYFSQASTLRQAYGLQDIRLTAVNPALARCEDLRGADVVYFRADVNALNLLTRLPCSPGKAYTLTALSPAYLL